VFVALSGRAPGCLSAESWLCFCEQRFASTGGGQGLGLDLSLAMAAGGSRARADYDYLIKLLLIGDSGMCFMYPCVVKLWWFGCTSEFTLSVFLM
jgi:hypothetical protein